MNMQKWYWKAVVSLCGLVMGHAAFAQTCSKRADSPAAPATATFSFSSNVYDI